MTYTKEEIEEMKQFFANNKIRRTPKWPELLNLKEEDQLATEKLFGYLERAGLEFKLHGSAINGDFQYNDVDVLAIGSSKQLTETICGLTAVESAPCLIGDHKHDNKPYSDKGYSIESKPVSEYAESNIDYRYEINVGPTKIDLCLKIKKEGDKLETIGVRYM